MKFLNASRKTNTTLRGLVLVLALLLVACGGDSDQPTPTATSSSAEAPAPTVPSLANTPEPEVSEDEISVITPVAAPSTPNVSTPEATESEEVDVASTPQPAVVDVATPQADLTLTSASPTAAEVQMSATTAPDVAASPTPLATERPRTGKETFTNPGDGTGGSGMPGEQETPEPTEVPLASPAASPVAQLSVTGCEVPDVPNFVGPTTAFVLTADLNFRSGPGAECEPLLDEPLGEGQTVEVTGGPVTQAEDGSEWVQISIDGTPGWIATEFIEPAE